MKPAGKTTIRNQLAVTKEQLESSEKLAEQLKGDVNFWKADRESHFRKNVALTVAFGVAVFLFFVFLSNGTLNTRKQVENAASAAYSSGLKDGKEAGIEESRELGHEDGYQEAQDEYEDSYQNAYDEGAQEGYGLGREEGYEEGYEDGLSKKEEDVDFLLKSLEQPYPESGTVHNATTEAQASTMNITNDMTCAYFCKVVSKETNGHYLEFFLRPDSSASVSLPLGTYYIYFQKSNDAWYGWDAGFWESGETGVWDYYYVSTGGTWTVNLSDQDERDIDEVLFKQLQKPSEVVTPSQMVWVPKISGDKYHSIETCCNMYQPYYVSIEWAKSTGHAACNNCW